MRKMTVAVLLGLSVYGLIGCLVSCGGGNSSLPKNEAVIANTDQSQMPPILDPEEMIRLQTDILKQRQRNVTRSVSYNRQAAVDYALNHWNLVRETEDFNHDGYFEPKAYPESLHDTNFRVFGNNCTAFVSQCLWAGSIPMYGINDPLRKINYWEPFSWWYDDWTDKRPDNGFGLDTRQSVSWINTDRFAWFLFFRIARTVRSFRELEPGDVISVDYEENKILGVTVPFRIDHTFIVIRITPDGDAICASNDRRYNDRSMREVVNYYKNYRVLFWAWHIDSNYISPPDSQPPTLTIDHPDSETDVGNVPTSSSTSSGGSAGSTPDPTDTAPPILSWAKIDTLGNGKFNLVAEFADDRSGVDKNRFWLQDPAYNWHQIGNWNFDNPSTLPVDMNGQTLVGNWKFFVEACDKSGNHLDRTDTNQRITWGAPWIEDQSMEGPSSTGQSVYRAKFDSFSGHDGVWWSELFYWIGERYYQIGSRIAGWQAEWNINPLDYANLEKGKVYPLTLIVMGTNGVKADMIPAGYYLTVPNVVIPLERGKESLVKYEPAGVPWHWENKYLAVTGWHGPYGPNNFNVNLTIYVEGTQHHSSTEHCPVVYGFRNNSNSYKVMGAWGYGYWMRFYGNVADLPTGLHCIGAEMRLDGRITGPIRAKDSWIWVDNDHPKFDKIVEGPASGSVIRKSQNTELCIRTTMQDPGGSGTAEYWLALVGQGEERGFKERIYGYTGINHCTITGLPNGQYGLYATYSRDQVGNVQTRSIATDVTFQIAD